ncbi:hypothetical protein MED193_03362 [Roseobacter sp. MED193]|uniref:hypothetical protein n=1 Tax=Roseobacter sp. MED193 TaxID=314262 RepID=UPI000068DC55|nr:hypothetical protein [Roseobacter sp. MED193]EAQ44624.1 hypothetical protein MED193_03362 [Roseobacter sp. MED193]
MPFILGAVAVIAAAYFWIQRARNAAEMGHELLDVANDIRLAARRFGFRRRNNLHPAETIDDPKIALAALGASFLELDDFPTAEQKEALIRGLREELKIPHEEAEELVLLGRWIMGECGGAQQAISRLSRRLYKLSEQTHFNTLVSLIQSIVKYGNGTLSQSQKTALEDVQHGLKIR